MMDRWFMAVSIGSLIFAATASVLNNGETMRFMSMQAICYALFYVGECIKEIKK